MEREYDTNCSSSAGANIELRPQQLRERAGGAGIAKYKHCHGMWATCTPEP